MVILVDKERHLTKPIPTHDEISQKTLNIGNFLSLIKNICGNPIVNIVFNGEELEAFHLKSGVKYLANDLQTLDWKS
jgi:hypothetical protein